MKLTSIFGVAVCGSVGVLACGGDVATNSGADETSAAGDAGETTADTAVGESADGTEDSEDTGVEMVTGVTLPQAINGAFHVDTGVYAEIPVHVLIDGTANSVTVNLDGTDYAADDTDGDGDWIATLPVSGTGLSQVTASAGGLDAAADLSRGTTGLQYTSQALDGSAVTPCVHRVGDEMYITWSDRKGGASRAVLQEIDGIGRRVGNEVLLVPANVDVANVRTAFSDRSVAMIYQVANSGPYSQFLRVVDFAGNELLAPVSLEPDAAWSGSFGGDLQWDGVNFVAAVRRNDGAGGGAIDYWRVDGDGGSVVGPKPVFDAGTSMTIGGIDPFEFTKLAVVGNRTFVSTVHDYYNFGLAFEVPKALLIATDNDGNVLSQDYAASPSDFLWSWEMHVYNLGPGEAVGLWVVDDLASPDNPAPTAIRAFSLTEADGAALNLGNGDVLVQTVDTRTEPHVMPHPTQHAVMFWLDQRSYSQTPAQGGIELTVATFDDAFALGPEFVFPHARVFAGLSFLNGAPAHTNIMMVWSDQRTGFPNSEIYLDTIWY